MRSRKVLVWTGLLGTLLYVVVLLWVTQLRLAELQSLQLNAIGDFFAGVFSPLALYWLILGFLMQSEELGQNSAALKLQAEELRSAVNQQKGIAEAQRASLDNYFNSQEPLLKVLLKEELSAPDPDWTSLQLENVGEYCEQLCVKIGSGSLTYKIDALFSGEHEAFFINTSSISEPLEINVGISYVNRLGVPGSQSFTFHARYGEHGIYFEVSKRPFLERT